MKPKYFFAAFLMAVFGSLVTILVFTGFIDKSPQANHDGARNDPYFRPRPTALNYTPGQDGILDFTDAAEKTMHAVVHVKVRSTIPGQEIDDPITEFFYGHDLKQPSRRVTGYGSGVIISPDGYIVTNNHVVEDSDSIGVILNNRQTFKAKLVGRDPETDLALLKINANSLPVIKYGNSEDLRPGQWVLAVGNPFNLGTTVTAGIVSAISRSIDFPDEDAYKLDSFIQTDAALNPGNSGGALVNPSAELVGITSAIISPTGAYSGNSFAIPVNIVRKVANDLRQFGKVQRAMLGISITEISPDLVSREKLKDSGGVFISAVTAGSGAADAGLKEKDVILKVENTNIDSPSEFQEVMGTYRPGDKVNITYSRGGTEKTVQVVLKNIEGGEGTLTGDSGSRPFEGAVLNPLSSKDKNRLGIESGVVVAAIGPGKLRDIGIKKGDIIVSINGKTIATGNDARLATNDGQTFNSIGGIQSNGTKFMLEF